MLALALLVSVPFSLAGGVMSRPHVVTIGPDAWNAVIVTSFVLAGGLLVHLRPRNPIGWILLVSGLLQVTNVGCGLVRDPGPDRSRRIAARRGGARLARLLDLDALAAAADARPAGPLPAGRPPSRYWAWHVRLSLLGIGLGVLAMATGPGGVDDTVAGTRLPWTAPEWSPYVLGLSAGALLIASAAGTLVGTLVRAWRATSPERQQLLWLIIMVAGVLATVFTGPELVFLVSYASIPAAVAIGVLRYRLLGIEVVLRRTLLYVPLTVLVALVIGGLTTVLTRLLPDGPGPLLAASAVVAVVVVHLAAPMRRVVDRFVLGDRADPWTVVDRLGAGLEVERDDPVTSMLEAVTSAVAASYAAVDTPDGHRTALVGTAPAGEPELVVPLRHGGELLGTLEIGTGASEPRLAGRDVRLVTAWRRSWRSWSGLGDSRTTWRGSAAASSRRPSPSGSGSGRTCTTAWDPPCRGSRSVSRPRPRPTTRTPAPCQPCCGGCGPRRTPRSVRSGACSTDCVPPCSTCTGWDSATREVAASLGMGRAGGPELDVRACALLDLPPRVEEAAFRIVAESLTNVVRHSAASCCVVEFQQADGDLRVLVTDDGSGLARATDSGHGLDSMRRRAADVGGRLSVGPADPTGTVVSAILPLVVRDVRLRLVIADDHPMYLYGLAAVLDQADEVKVVARVADGPSLVLAVTEHVPDVVVTDLSMPGLDGVTAIQQLREHRPDLPILALTMHEDDEHVFAALRAGAHGYLVKGADGEEIVPSRPGRRLGRLGLRRECGAPHHGLLRRTRRSDPRRTGIPGAHGARARRARAARRRLPQPRDRPAARHVGQDGAQPRVPGAEEAPGARPHGGRVEGPGVRRPTGT